MSPVSHSPRARQDAGGAALHASATQIEAFRRDGVVVIRNAVSPDWVARMNAVAEAQMAAPGKWVNDQPQAGGGRLFTDRYLWRDNAQIRDFVFESGLAGLMGELMGSDTIRLYFDHLLIKEPGTAVPTPWHQDTPYWPFQGQMIGSSWVAMSDATVEQSAMEFVRASHRTGITYAPAVFGDSKVSRNAHWQTQSTHQPVPDIEADRNAFDIVSWDMKAGDAVFFSAWMLHSARGNASGDTRRVALSLRWLGDDALWDPRPGTDPTVTAADVSVPPGSPATDDDRFPVVWKAARPSLEVTA